MLLSARVTYYKKLGEEDRQKFIERIYKFEKDKEFIPRNEVEISDPMEDVRILISAAAIQVTFGLDAFEFPYFTKVFIYPCEYYSILNRHWHKGEMNPMGIIVFSWKDLKQALPTNTNKQTWDCMKWLMRLCSH